MEKDMEQRLKKLANVLHDAAKEAQSCSEYPRQVDELQFTLRSKKFENEFLRTSLDKTQKELREKDKESRASLNVQHVLNNTLNARLKESLRRENELRQKLQETLENKSKYNEVSDPLRPTNVAEIYQELYDNEWTDAYEELEKDYLHHEEQATQALIRVLKNTMEFCKTMIVQQNYQLQASLLLTDKKTDVEISQNLQRQLMSCKKQLASVTIENMSEMYFSKLHQSNDLGNKRELRIQPFVKECIRISWMCLIQYPPLIINFEQNARGTSFNTDIYKPYTKSGTSIDFIVLPALLLHENGPVLAKGIAQGYTSTSSQTARKELFWTNLCTDKTLSKSETNLRKKGTDLCNKSRKVRTGADERVQSRSKSTWYIEDPHNASLSDEKLSEHSTDEEDRLKICKNHLFSKFRFSRGREQRKEHESRNRAKSAAR